MKALWQHPVLVVTAGLLVAVLAVAAVTFSGHRASEQAQDTQIRDLERTLADVEREHAETVDATMIDALGVSRTRVASDTRTITTLLRTAFTWDSGETYVAARERVKNRYGLAEDDPFLVDFLAPAQYTVDAEGRRHYRIDTVGLHSSLSGEPSIGVARVVGTDYHYTVLAEVAATSDVVDPGQASTSAVTSHRTMLLFLRLDAEGVVSGLVGYPAGGQARHSG